MADKPKDPEVPRDAEGQPEDPVRVNVNDKAERSVAPDKEDVGRKDPLGPGPTDLAPWRGPVLVETADPVRFDERVQVLQRAMVRRGRRVEIDGFFGSQTASAVKAFQREAKLEVNGAVDRETWDAIFRAPVV